MTSPIAPDHLETAIGRFRSFFEELRGVFIERDAVLTQFCLALLSRQHVLMTGPPGTGKSQMASLVLGRIIDETKGAPSLFARQFTENTVQTDLVGPIDFKTLMESGRTEHFTDEGMLGSVHAFLDEVFDGRDMLLRSTLNILHEREVKQGGTITKGRIECAFMTSNRYIAEVLDTTRETLLAFIDRIPFISFIPRGFADARSLATVVRRHGGGFGRHRPTAYLAVQDLDVLQAAADLTYVPEVLCDSVATLVRNLDAELSEAQRYDPKFQPTRYLSTRSAVLATQVLRAAVVFDKIFVSPKRTLQATHADLAFLRYFLLLNGVPRDGITALLEQETDPRERRQLDIMATEAEVFDRCLSALPATPADTKPRTLALEQLEEMAAQARRTGDPDALAKAVRSLIEATESGATNAKRAASLLVETVGTLSGQALRGGLTPDLQGSLDTLGTQLQQMADQLERAPGYGLPLAQWLRQRLRTVIDDSLTLAAMPSSETVEALAKPDEAQLRKRVNHHFEQAEATAALRRQLGPEGETEGTPDEVWAEAMQRLEDEVVLLWDARFLHSARKLLGGAADIPLDRVLRRLDPVLTRLRADADRMQALGHRSELVRRVTGPRMEPLVARVFRRLEGNDREEVVRQVEAVVGELGNVGLQDAIAPERFVTWALPAVLPAKPPPPAAAVKSREQFEKATKAEPRLLVTETLVRIAIAALPPEAHRTAKPDQAAAAVWDTLRGLDEPIQRRLIEHDLAQVRRGVDRLESWWRTLQPQGESESKGKSKGKASATPGVDLLEVVVQTGFLRALRGEGEPLRLVTQLEHLREVFPASEEPGQQLRSQLGRLDEAVTRTLVDLLQRKSEQAWSSTLSS